MLRNLFIFSSMLAILAIPATASAPVPSPDIAVTTPATGDEVVSPFTLLANAKTCLNQPVVCMGYSLDDEQSTTVKGGFLQVSIEATPGLHTVHVKAWGKKGG